MKKFILAAAFLLSAGFIHAFDGDFLSVPRAGEYSLQSADYGGVQYSTGSGTTGQVSTAAFVGSGRYLVYSVVFTTGVATDFVQIIDTGSAVGSLGIGGNSQEAIRFYNVAKTTSSPTSSSTYSGENALSRPIRLNNGLAWKSSSAVYNMITVLYYKLQER